MKTKKITILSIVLAALIVIGTTTVCATSAKVENSQADSATISAGIEKTYTENGKTYYVLWDGSIDSLGEIIKIEKDIK